MGSYGKVLTAASVLALSLALGMGPASAESKKKGPRASLAANTVCDVDGTDFHATIRLEDQSSGATVAPVVTASNIEALQKTQRGNWTDQPAFAFASSGSDASLQDITATFDLCQIQPGAKAVNAAATILYDNDGTGGDPREITNMCSDDPNTFEIEPSGIAIDAEAILALCPSN